MSAAMSTNEASASEALASILNDLHMSFTIDRATSVPTASLFLTVEKNPLRWWQRFDEMSDTMKTTRGSIIALPNVIITAQVPTVILASLEFLHRLTNNTTTALHDRRIKSSKHLSTTYNLQDTIIIPELTGKMNNPTRPEMQTLLGHLQKTSNGSVSISRVVPNSESITTDQATQLLGVLKSSLDSATRSQVIREDWRLNEDNLKANLSKETDQVRFSRGVLDALDVECTSKKSRASMDTIRGYLNAPRV